MATQSPAAAAKPKELTLTKEPMSGVVKSDEPLNIDKLPAMDLNATMQPKTVGLGKSFNES